MVWAGGSAQDFGVNQLFIQHPRTDSVRRSSGHQDADQLFLRVDPEARAPGAGLLRVAGGAGGPAHGVVQAPGAGKAGWAAHFQLD